MNQTPFEQFINEHQERVILALQATLSFQPASEKLYQAICYCLLNPGKRMRPLLVYATGLSLGAESATLDWVAIAIELIHCYSLIHDDLPAMDDDDLRRGLPTCHKAFDEATAILAGDALQALAFEILSSPQSSISPQHQLQMIQCLAKASGPQGMVGGQMLDLEGENSQLNLTEIQAIHSLKTGALISASIELGALAGAADLQSLKSLQTFGQHLGIAFQIQDDILDVEGETQILGKSQGADQLLGKSTYPKLLGLENSKLKLREHYEAAVAALEPLNNTDYLIGLANWTIKRRC